MGIVDLWLAIVLSGVLVFVVSSILHMATPLHKGDYQKLPGEESIMEVMRKNHVTPGTYMFPCPQSMKDMNSPEMVAKYEKGPVAYMTVIPSGVPAMGKNLVQWFLYSILIGVFAAYVASRTLTAEASYLQVFRVVGCVAFVAYAIGHLHASIWEGRSWWITSKFVLGGMIYALVTAGVFGWLWP